MKRVLAVALLALVAGVFWWRATPEPVPRVVPAHASPPDAKSDLPVASVLRVRPAPQPAVVASPRPPQAASRESPRLAQWHDGIDYASLYRSLDGDASGEALYLRAEIYAKCATHGDKGAHALADERASERTKFVAALGGRANAAQRIDAFDRMHQHPCTGLDLGKFEAETLNRMVAAAADAGDPRAKAWQLAERIEGRYYATQRVDRRSTGYQLTSDDFAEARTLLASADPGVIADLQGLLSSSLEHGMVELEGQAIDQAAFHSALTLLACDAGARCGPDNPQLLMNCAYRGRCDAGTVSESMFYYETSPAQAQIIDRYHRALLAMLNARDFSGLTLGDADRVPGFSMTFGGRRVIWPEQPVPVAEPAPPKSASRRATVPAE